MRPVQAICFDLDHTLLDPTANANAVQRACEAIAEARPGLDAVRMLEANRSIWPSYFQEAEEAWVTGQLDTPSLVREAWRRTLAACDCSDEQLIELAGVTHSRLTLDGYRLFDDVLACFEALRPDLKRALITNGASDLQREKLRLLDIEGRFDFIAVSGEHGVAKPDAAVFRLVMKAFDVPPASIWHIGDNLRADVGGAKAAGLTAVWLNREGATRREDDPVPDHEIASLGELARLLV